MRSVQTLYVTVAPPEREGLVKKLLTARRPSSREQGMPFGHEGATGALYTWTGSLSEEFAQIPFLEVVATATLNRGPEVTIRFQQVGGANVAGQIEAARDLVRQIALTIVRHEQMAGPGDAWRIEATTPGSPGVVILTQCCLSISR